MSHSKISDERLLALVLKLWVINYCLEPVCFTSTTFVPELADVTTPVKSKSTAQWFGSTVCL